MSQIEDRLTARRQMFWGVLVVSALILVTIALLLPLYSSARPSSLKYACYNNLRQVVLALHSYHDDYGSLPPTSVADHSGAATHSWRVLILPYLEEDSLYAAYRFDEPWNGPNNRKLAEMMPAILRCPADATVDETNYVAVAGPETMWNGTEVMSFDAIPNKGLRTIALVEVANSGIHWMEPRDLDVGQAAVAINSRKGQGISSNHRGGANVAFADGTVRFLRNDTPLDRLEAMLTIDGGETALPGR